MCPLCAAPTLVEGEKPERVEGFDGRVVERGRHHGLFPLPRAEGRVGGRCVRVRACFRSLGTLMCIDWIETFCG